MSYRPFGLATNSAYGIRRSIRANDIHYGQDFRATNGTLVPAATAGTVVFSGYNDTGRLGWVVM